MSCSDTPDCLCGCCTGTTVLTPQTIKNSAGLPAVAYRVGTWATFKESMLARLSSVDYPALASLKTRDSDDFTIAFIDAVAVVLDILTFYQERLANESYLRTAVQIRSLTELSRLIGYSPAPGVSAVTYLAFTLQEAPGQTPDPTTQAITIPTGTQAQSVPAQGATPQTFETAEDILAKADWNALAVQTGIPWVPADNDLGVYLQGTSTALSIGDLILIVGDERLKDNTNENWDVRVVTSVVADGDHNRTYVEWSMGLGDPDSSIGPAKDSAKFYVFRQRASLFGYNAMNPKMIDVSTLPSLPIDKDASGSPTEWSNFRLDKSIDLDASYSKVTPKSWLAMIRQDGQTSRSPAGWVSLYYSNSLAVVSRSDFGISAKITRIYPEPDNDLGEFPLRETMAFAQSENLAVAEQPLTYPLYGAFIDLETLRSDLLGKTAIALSGKAQKLSVLAKGLTFVPDDGSDDMPLMPGDTVTIANTSPLPLNPDGTISEWIDDPGPRTLTVNDAHGRSGQIKDTALKDFKLVISGDSDPDVGEYAVVASISTVLDPFPRTRIALATGLQYCYDRVKTTVNANVGLATHGQSVSEILGSGSAATGNQSFTLKQKPVTYTQAPTPTGRQSTLDVRADSRSWSEVDSLYGQAASATAFKTLTQDDGSTKVVFGDRVEGSTLPTGQNNIQASYRIGSGAAGNVLRGSITTLMDRPYGVSGVTNPAGATGGEDAESLDELRENAPQTVLTLGRAVSITDYENYARTFAGIAKAHAIWLPSGPGRGVFLTVAGVDGAALPAGNATLSNLVSSLRSYGNPLVTITAVTFVETLFGFTAKIKYDSAFDEATVTANVRTALVTTFSFDNREFGQGVSVDEVAALIQGIEGVVAVQVSDLQAVTSSTAGDFAALGGFSVSASSEWDSKSFELNRPYGSPVNQLCAYLPVADPKAVPQAAEILVLDPDTSKVVLGVMA